MTIDHEEARRLIQEICELGDHVISPRSIKSLTGTYLRGGMSPTKLREKAHFIELLYEAGRPLTADEIKNGTGYQPSLLLGSPFDPFILGILEYSEGNKNKREYFLNDREKGMVYSKNIRKLADGDPNAS